MFYVALAASLAGPIAGHYAVFAAAQAAGSDLAVYTGLVVQVTAAIVGIFLFGLSIDPDRLVDGTRWVYLYYTAGLALAIGGVRFGYRTLKLRR